MATLVVPEAAPYAAEHTSPSKGAIATAAAWTKTNTPDPTMMSWLAEARLLEALMVISGARRFV